PLTLPEREREHDFIPAMWASRKIGTLLEEIRLHGESAELKNEVIRLSKEYGILTPYTSFLVEEPGVRRPVLGLRRQDGAALGPAGRGAYGMPGIASPSSAPAGGPGGGGFGGGIGGFGGAGSAGGLNGVTG